MQFIASKTLVHRDLAARNILLCANNVAKISDFGLCCKCDETLTYQALVSKKLPIKWLAIETLVDHTFSQKSDVWSFGVLAYEMFTLGQVPYATLDHNEVFEFLKSGKRLERPEAMPEEVYEIVRTCWEENQNGRPDFTELEERFHNKLEKQTESYGYLTQYL
jgi:serine/threonine protein kinase